MSSLLRSTKFVRYFTGAARTLLLNSAKTAETNLIINSKALCAANNVLMRDYATKKAESLDPLLQKLDFEVRRYGRITKKDIDEVFDEIRARNDITSSQSLLVIRCCGELVPEELPEQRTLLVQKIWSVLTERGIPMDISHYNALLRVYLENEHPFSPAQFLEELEKKGLQPNRVTYQRLMWRYCQEGDVEGATKVLEKMRELNFPVSEPVLNALVMGHAFHGDTEGAKAVLETMARAGLQPTNRTFTLLACGFAKKGDIDGINGIIKMASDKDAILSDKDVLEIIEHLAVGGHEDKIEQLFPHLQKSIGYNQEVCNLVLRLLNKGQLEAAKKMLPTMPKSTNVEDTPFKGAFFIKQLLRVSKSADDVVKTCLELKEEGLIPNAILIATENALIQGRTEMAQKLFVEYEKEGHEVRSHFYWPLLAQKVKENDEEGLLQIVKDMNHKNINISGEALRDYVIPYLLNKDPKSVISKLQLANVSTSFAARNLLFEVLERGNIKEAAQIAIQYRTRGNFSLLARPLLNALSKTRNTDSFVSIIHVLSSKPQNQSEEESQNEDLQNEDTTINEVSRIVKSGVKIVANANLVEKMLSSLRAKGIRISVESAEAIELYLGENMTTKISEILSQLTSSELETVPLENVRSNIPRNSVQLEALINQLQNKDGANINRLKKQLLLTYIAENNVDKVTNYVDELKSSNFEITPTTYAQLYEFFCQNDQIEKAKECQAAIAAQYPNFALNKYKLVLMAYAMVRANRYDEAIAFLKESKPVDDAESGYMLNSKSWQILNTLAEQKDPAKVKEMTDTLISNNYIAPSNVLLGPSIKVHLLSDNLDRALAEFEECCKKYRSTPWKGELMKALIMKEDATRLQWLADLSTQIHGEVNILHDLVLAFVECGRLRQARRILETPGLQTRHRRLDDACLRYVEEGKSEYLEGLLEATKELSHIDRSNIFYHLLVTYCKNDETDKALGLWTLLQEEGEIPSEQFLMHLGNHLRTKNREIPFVMPETPTSKSAKSKEKVTTKAKPVEPQKYTKLEISTTIEELVKNGELDKAMDVAIKSLKDNVIPKSSVLKFLLKNLAERGNVEKIQEFGKYIGDGLMRKVTYNDKLTLAIFNQGNGGQHIDTLLRTVQAAETNEDLETALKKFPRSSALESIVKDSDLVVKCQEVAEISAEKGILLPVNLLWMEYVLSGQNEEADRLWKKYMTNAEIVMFRRLLQESHVRKQPELIHKLIDSLKSNKTLSKGSLENAYSRLISYHLAENNVSEAENILQDAVKSGCQKEDLNKSCLDKLKAAVESEGRKFNVNL